MAAYISCRVATLSDYSAKPNIINQKCGLSYGKQLWYYRTSLRLSDKFIEISIFFSFFNSMSVGNSKITCHISKYTSPRPSVGLYTSWIWNFSPFSQNVNSLFERKKHTHWFTDIYRWDSKYANKTYSQVNPLITSTQTQIIYIASHFRWLTLTEVDRKGAREQPLPYNNRKWPKMF